MTCGVSTFRSLLQKGEHKAEHMALLHSTAPGEEKEAQSHQSWVIDKSRPCTRVLLCQTYIIWLKGQLPKPPELGTGHGHSPSCSSILSHSSKIKCLICLRFRLLFRARARIRPGVPTTMCGQFFFSTSSSFLIDRPPENTATCQPTGKSHKKEQCSSLPSSHSLPIPLFETRPHCILAGLELTL